MQIGLPPKRFNDPSDSIYDSIRFKGWYGKLETRREQIKFLKQAHLWLISGAGKHTQEQAAASFNVDERELRDYTSFISGYERPKPPSYQLIMDSAYAQYCGLGGERHIRYFLEKVAPFYGIIPRHVTENWEICPRYWPTGYLQG